MENNKDKYFECSSTLKSLTFLIFLFFALGLFVLSGYFFSTLYFYGNDIFSLHHYGLFFLIFFALFLIFTIPTVVSDSCKYTFYEDRIDFCFKYIKRKNFSLKYEDIEFFMNERYFGIQVKANNNEIAYRLYPKEEFIPKITEILNSKISDLAESEKCQALCDKEMSKFPFFITRTSVAAFIFMLISIPVSSFFEMKMADYNFNKFIKSNFEDNKSLDTAHQLYISAAHNKCYYAHKQYIKIDIYKNKLLEADIEYVNKLFPDKKEETESLRKTEGIYF
ncbi:MAG: hypothetical protein ACI37T_03700 [Candidatus Gastranaerophilaceae bacterium]